MSPSIPYFAEKVAPSYSLLKSADKKVGRRTKGDITNEGLVTRGWKEMHPTTFHGLQNEVLHSVKLSHRYPALGISVYSDASDTYCSSVVIQDVEEEMRKPMARASPFSRVSSLTVSGAQKNCSNYKKRLCCDTNVPGHKLLTCMF